MSVFCLSVSFLLMLFGLMDAAAFTQPGRILAQQDPTLTALIEKVGLEYRKGAPEAARVEELRGRVKQAYMLAGIEGFSELREQAILLILRSGKGFEWETLRSIDLGNGERAGVWLTVPVWVPRGAQAVATFGAPANLRLSLTIEVLQSMLPSRNSSSMDILTNTMGSVIGAIILNIAFALRLLGLRAVAEGSEKR